MLDTKIDHDYGTRRCSAVCTGYHYVSSSTPSSKAAPGAAPKVSTPQLDFFEDCSVVDLAKKINLNLSGIVKSNEKSQSKEPNTDTELKEATKTAHLPKPNRRKEQLIVKLNLLMKENALRRQIISQHAALARAEHALKLR